MEVGDGAEALVPRVQKVPAGVRPALSVQLSPGPGLLLMSAQPRLLPVHFNKLGAAPTASPVKWEALGGSQRRQGQFLSHRMSTPG